MLLHWFILLLALWRASFNDSCTSDGCLGVLFLFGIALLMLLAQLLIFKALVRRGPEI